MELEPSRSLHKQETEWFREAAAAITPGKGEREATPALPQGGGDCRDSRRGSSDILSPPGRKGLQQLPARDMVKGVRISEVTHLQAQINSLHANPSAHTLGELATAFIFCPLGFRISPSPRIQQAAQAGRGPQLHQKLSTKHPGPFSPAQELTAAIETIRKHFAASPSQEQTHIVSALHTRWHFMTPMFRKAILQHF